MKYLIFFLAIISFNTFASEFRVECNSEGSFVENKKVAYQKKSLVKKGLSQKVRAKKEPKSRAKKYVR
ncbi:MAG: hypothetical protein N4A33_05620 [Bacteriovoracaceae bacterium]|jgi:hypothetical protein|nr:hypothetical protein [Bacteriovoracaceae bacterium]